MTMPPSTPIVKIAARDLTVHPKAQRTFVSRWADGLARDMDTKLLGVFHVTQADGAYYVFDGQHRLAALMQLGMGDFECNCLLYDADDAEACATFRGLSRIKQITAYDNFAVGVVAQDRDCLAVQTIAANAGFGISRQSANGQIAAVQKLVQVYAKTGGPEALIATLTVIREAWGSDRDACDGHIITGLGTVYLRYGGEIETPVMARKLAKRHGGPMGLVADAKGLVNLRGGTVGRAMAELIVGEYNRKRSKGRLGPL